MKGIAVVGFLAAVVFSAASSPGQALLLDGAALRAEIVRRQAGYTGRLDAALKRKQLGLERALLALDSPSSTLQGDLRIARWTAQALDRPFGTDGPLFGMVEEYADRASALTAGARDGLEACLAAETDAEAAADALLHLARADRRLAAAETAATRARRIRLLEAAMREVDAGLLALEEGAGAPLASGSVGMPVGAPALPYAWTPDLVTATVTLDAEGAPVAFEIFMVQAPGGGPVSSQLRLRTATDFTGVGFYEPSGTFDTDMAASIMAYSFLSISTGSVFEVTTFDADQGRIAGNFTLRLRTSGGMMSGFIREGTFDIRAPILVRKP